MTRKFEIIIGAAASVLAFAALAQDSPNLKTDGANPTRDGMTQAQHRGRLNDAAKASNVIGKTVLNNQGEKLGKVKDLAVDLQSGRIVQVILSTGGFLGVDNTLTAVPPEALHCDAAHKVLHLDADQEKLANAPKFDSSKWAEDSDSNHLAAVYRYYGEEPAFCFIQGGDAAVDGQPGTVSNRKADGSQCLISESRLGQVEKASRLLGRTVKDLQGEKVGHVENILVDLPSGRVVAVIVSSGGFLGMDGELSAIPPTAFHFGLHQQIRTTSAEDGQGPTEAEYQTSRVRNVLQLDTSKERLSNAPHFKADQWPDFAQPGYTGGVYSAYNVEPYFNTNAVTDVDDTARNVRDRDNQTLTPLNQGTSQADLDTTAQIRKEILADKDMSTDARNVKIITIDGQVTLRGPVNTIEEKHLIGDMANRIAGAGKVNNHLQVKLTASNNN